MRHARQIQVFGRGGFYAWRERGLTLPSSGLAYGKPLKSNVRRLSMLFAIVEDGMVRVIEDQSAARREFEGIDIESGVVAFYAQDGRPLLPRFTLPNKRKLFGLLVESGGYDLSPAFEATTNVDSFEIAIGEATGVEPNPHFKSIFEIRAHVESQKNDR